MMSTTKEETNAVEEIAQLTVKEFTQQLVNALPDDATWEDVEYQVYMFREVHEGAKQIADGESITLEEAKENLSKWLK